MSKKTIILGIESSCDETSAAILEDKKILSNVIANQEIHQQYGGVVPELASRAHQQNIIPVVDTAIKKANIKKEDVDALLNALDEIINNKEKFTSQYTLNLQGEYEHKKFHFSS